jgi:sirohydrochlorin cobaltochelatase
MGSFSDAGLVVLGHGSSKNGRSGDAVYLQCNFLRDQNEFAEVREAFWKQAPNIKEVLSATKQPRVFIVPLFISEGYFTEQVIPRELGFLTSGAPGSGRIRKSSGQTVFYCKPVGTHPSMTQIVLRRASEVLQKFPFPMKAASQETTLCIVGHGTEQDKASRQAIDAQVQAIGQLKVFAAIHGLFLEEEPRVPACYEMAKTKNIVVLPLLVSEGLHGGEDIPILLGAPERTVRERIANGQAPWRNPTEKHGKLVWYAESVGSDPGVADIILERAQEAVSWITPGTQ